MPRLTDQTTNLRTTFMKLIARAGYEPWPRLFHNMRASCATDWAEALPRPRGRQVARPQPAGGSEALPADAGRALRGGDQGWGAGGVGRDGATPPDNGLSPESQAFSENRWNDGS